MFNKIIFVIIMIRHFLFNLVNIIYPLDSKIFF